MMNDPLLDRNAFPYPLATVEDYEKAYTDFAQPFLLGRSTRINELIGTEGANLFADDSNATEEEMAVYIERIKAASKFPDDVNEFLEELTALERKLEAEGLLDEESV
jgi:hypothetical protein